MLIYIGSDHAGFELKGKLILFLEKLGHKVEDKGPLAYNQDDDYPDFIRPVAEAVASDPERSRGIVIGKSGQGEAMCANRVKGARAAVFYGGSLSNMILTREHNDANILSLGAGFVGEDMAMSAVKLWLETPFTNEERHVRRLKKLDI
ncbi:MAG: RpiB/LacA/LacB family sugar-phosphate isomerase [Patescibacteria group bacterium]